VVDPLSFLSWKDEAFNIWMERWGTLYESESQSRKIIEQVANTYLLVNLVDNDFPKETCMWSLLNEMLNQKEKEDKNNSNENVIQQ
jgi:methylenetetrahydrofolate reductase (NADPH)